MKNLVFFIIPVFVVFAACNSVSKPENDVAKDTEVTENPFYQEYDTPFGVPPFDKVKPEHIMPAFKKGIEQHNEAILAIVNNTEEPGFENTIEAFMYSGELLEKVGTVFYAFSSANTGTEIQELEKEINPMWSAHSDEISMNPDLFARVKAVYDKRDSLDLNEEQLFILENMYKEFVRQGALLSKEKQEELKKINQRIATLRVQFGQNLLAETNGFELVVDNEDDLAGLPQSVIDAAAEKAANSDKEGKWVFTTHKPSMLPFLQYAEKRDLREKLYKAYTMRGNNDNEYDNKDIVAEIVRLRAEKANIMGYENHASFRLENRMAQSPEKAMDLLNKLWKPAVEVAKNEAEELQKIIDAEGKDFKLQSWDWWYYAEKLRKQKYNLDESELRPYFSLDNVREGIFLVAKKLYGITFSPIENIPAVHEEATAYEVKEEDGSHLGVLYLDFHPRESKRGGAWCGGYRDHKVKDGEEITPLVTIVCNFTRPTKTQPSLLSMDEVETFFHEFGHALDGLFSQKSYPNSYIAWDFVELPSQIMEHWAFHPDVLALYAKHYETGETIPDELVEKINNSKYFNQGFDNVEYLAASLLDLKYHTMEEPQDINVVDFEKEYFAEIGLLPEIVSRYRSTYFRHIIGGYDAGYYSYIWAAVLDNDAFDAFAESDIFSREVAKSFRENVLAKNGIENAMEMYVNFRGREPEIEPLLRNRGLNRN